MGKRSWGEKKKRLSRTLQKTGARKKVLKNILLNTASCQQAGRNVRAW